MVAGMFETKSNFEFETYNDINSNIYEWKEYNDAKLVENSHGLLEMQFELDDATLMGSSNHLERMTEVISRYQIRLNITHIRVQAVIACVEDPSCSSVLNIPKQTMLAHFIEWKLSDFDTQTKQ